MLSALNEKGFSICVFIMSVRIWLHILFKLWKPMVAIQFSSNDLNGVLPFFLRNIMGERPLSHSLMPGLFFILAFVPLYLSLHEMQLLPITSVKLCPCQGTKKLGHLEARNREVLCRNNCGASDVLWVALREWTFISL